MVLSASSGCSSPLMMFSTYTLQPNTETVQKELRFGGQGGCLFQGGCLLQFEERLSVKRVAAWGHQLPKQHRFLANDRFPT